MILFLTVPTVLFLVRSGCVLAAVLAGVGVCADVWCCSAPVRVLCVSPRSRPAPPCVFEQYLYTSIVMVIALLIDEVKLAPLNSY